MGETRVDLQHLLEDLRDAYPGPLEETILTEMVANGLDSGATAVAFVTDPVQSTLTVVDNGAGMDRRELSRYHNIAASTKTRGEGIGFAGVGIKLGLLACEEVLTETKRGKNHVATTWSLAHKHRAPWKWVTPVGLVEERGTGVRLKLKNLLSPLLDGGFIESAVQRHFQPLLDSAFEGLLREHYSEGVRFLVNGREVARQPPVGERAPLFVRLGRKRKPSAVGYLERLTAPLPEDQQGIAISTLGKIIKRGWDWLGNTPATPDRVGGLIEVPGLAGCLTLNKADFIRTGSRGVSYLAYRKAIQEVVFAQLALWGDARDAAEETHKRLVRPLERDLQTVLLDLAEDFPLLASLVEQRRGGQKRLPMGPGARLPGFEGGAEAVVSEAGAAGREQAAPPEAEAPAQPTASEPPEKPAAGGNLPAASGPKRPARYGLSIQFESRPDDPELGRLLESTVWVNEAHPAYRRAVASRSEGYHVALTVAMALASLAVEPPEARGFITAFLEHWGEALDRGGRKPRSSGRGGSR
jgi:hypothetical protein